MKIKSLLVLCIVMAAGCAKDGKFVTGPVTGPCGTVAGYTFTGIVYGDSHMIVIPVSEIRPNTEWRFYLQPTELPGDPLDYKTVTVHVKGKFPAVNPPPDANNWIDVANSFDGLGGDKYLVECVPATAAEGDTFEYLVEIDQVGELDPRARVD